MIAMRFLRFVSISEGFSYLLLLLVAMPLKYIWGVPIAVKWVGLAHGVLFISLAVSVLLAMALAALPFRTACVVGVASLLPAGSFFTDRLLRRHMEKLAREEGSRLPRHYQTQEAVASSDRDADAAVADMLSPACHGRDPAVSNSGWRGPDAARAWSGR
jgi:integral membrane protein